MTKTEQKTASAGGKVNIKSTRGNGTSVSSNKTKSSSSSSRSDASGEGKSSKTVVRISFALFTVTLACVENVEEDSDQDRRTNQFSLWQIEHQAHARKWYVGQCDGETIRKLKRKSAFVGEKKIGKVSIKRTQGNGTSSNSNKTRSSSSSGEKKSSKGGDSSEKSGVSRPLWKLI